MSLCLSVVAGGCSEVIIEKHWRGLTNRNVCDFFMEEVNKYREREDVPPIITTSKYYLVSTFRDDLFVLAVVTNEVLFSCCMRKRERKRERESWNVTLLVVPY